MKRHNLFTITALCLSIAFTSCGGNGHESEASTDGMEESMEGEAKDVTINTASSKVMWKGQMLGMHSHEGNIMFKEGAIQVKGDQVVGGNFTIDMGTITPTDEGYKDEDGRRKEDLVGHLSSPDFFDVANHPTASFAVTSVNGNTAKGNLTIRGNTHEETVENLTITNENGVVKITGDLTFDRTKYDVSFKHPMQEMVLSDDINLKIDISAS